MTQMFFVGIGAGLAAALLFLAPAGGTTIAFPLFILTGVPVAIAALGWGVVSGAIATLFAAVSIWLILGSPPSAFVYLALFGAPALYLSWLSGLSRATAPEAREWYPPARILLHATFAVGLGISVAGIIAGFDPAALAREASTMLAEMLAEGTTGKSPTAEEVEPFMRLYAGLMPFVAGMLMTFATVFNVWAAHRIVRFSGAATRPVEPLWRTPSPRELLGVFVIAAVLALVLHGGVGDIARTFAGTSFAALALIGMAVLHALTLGLNGRTGLLVAAYALTLVSGVPLLLFAIVGVLDPFLNFRARSRGSSST